MTLALRETALPAIPVIETERLRLRAPRLSDFETVAAFLASDRARFLGGPMTRREAWRSFGLSVAPWLLDGSGYWSVEERETGSLIGAVGFLGPPRFPERELGWGLYEPRFEGRGYVTEAALAARAWGFGRAGFSTLVSYVHRDNARSIRVAERLGCERDASAPPIDDDGVVFRHPAPGARAA